jgi:uncharacterized protein
VQSLVEEWGRPDLSLAALHHDSHEAFICDVPTPLKRLLSSATATYEDIAMRLDAAIAMAFGFRVPHGDDKLLIERADRQAFLVEVKALMPALADVPRDVSNG